MEVPTVLAPRRCCVMVKILAWCFNRWGEVWLRARKPWTYAKNANAQTDDKVYGLKLVQEERHVCCQGYHPTTV